MHKILADKEGTGGYVIPELLSSCVARHTKQGQKIQKPLRSRRQSVAPSGGW